MGRRDGGRVGGRDGGREGMRDGSEGVSTPSKYLLYKMNTYLTFYFSGFE